MPAPSASRLALFIPSLACGGAERMTLNLAEAMAALGITIDLVVGTARGELADQVPAGVRLIDLRHSHVRGCLLPLRKYLKQERPAGMISRMLHANTVAALACRLSNTRCRSVLVDSTNLAALFSEGTLARRLKYRLALWPLLRRMYTSAHAIVAVSRGVAADLRHRLPACARKITQINNPVIRHGFSEQLHASPPHPWLEPCVDHQPTLVAVGSLRHAKGIDILLRALNLARTKSARLLVYGEGPERANLTALAASLGLRHRVHFPGFCPVPAVAMASADLFVLPSRREGSPNALTEALATGTPVIAADCPSGPREILKDGMFGRLVPQEDEAALAAAIDATLQAAHDPLPQQQRANDFSAELAAVKYLHLLQWPGFQSTLTPTQAA